MTTQTQQATHTPDTFADLRELSPEAQTRMTEWVNGIEETQAKVIAAQVADTWSRSGVEAAKLNFAVATAGLMRWEQSAVVDMCTALRVKAMHAELDKASHTPGPWSVKDDSSNVVVVVVDSTGEAIAEIWVRKGFTFKANANLISTAPELLEALTDMVERFDVLCTTEKFGGQYHRSADRARAAIARATGGTENSHG